jgi:hypothetical protein
MFPWVWHAVRILMEAGVMRAFMMLLMVLAAAGMGFMASHLTEYGDVMPFLDGLLVYNALLACEKKSAPAWEAFTPEVLDRLFDRRQLIIYEKDCQKIPALLTP